MTAIIRAFFGRLRRLFRRSVTNTRRRATKRNTRRRRSPDSSQVSIGEPSLADVLARLPRLHKVLRKTPKKVRLDNDLLYRMGPLMITGDATFCAERRKLWRRNPTQVFTGVLFENGPTFLAAVKCVPPANVQHKPGDCYQYMLYYDFTPENDVKASNWFGGYCFVDSRGFFSLAKQRIVKQHRITKKHKRRGESPYIDIPQIVYEDPFFEAVKADMKSDPTDVLNLYFRSSFNHWAHRQKYWLTITKQNNQRVTFAVNEGQHKYFFRDRDKTVVTPSGQRKKIFHIVSEHERKINAKTVIVREHSRGIRHFDWHGFECHIFSPGWHGDDYFSSLDVTTYSEDDDLSDDLQSNLVDATGYIEKMARNIEGTAKRRLT